MNQTSTASIDRIVERVSEGGNLLENLRLIKPETWQTAVEVFDAWQKGVTVEGVNTADLGVYRLVDGNVVFNLVPRAGNPFADERFMNEIYRGILSNEFYHPTGDMLKHIMQAIPQALQVDYFGLDLVVENENLRYGHVLVKEQNTDTENRLIIGVYGAHRPIGKKIILLRPDLVKGELKTDDDLVALACYRNDHQNFSAIDKLINDSSSAVRGVRRVSVSEQGKGNDEPLIVAPRLRKAYLALRAEVDSFTAPNGVYRLEK